VVLASASYEKVVRTQAGSLKRGGNSGKGKLIVQIECECSCIRQRGEQVEHFVHLLI
jgi:hypothetical protein